MPFVNLQEVDKFDIINHMVIGRVNGTFPDNPFADRVKL
jgi:hypothetical protein